MGRRKRRRQRRATSAAPEPPAKHPDESFELDVVEEQHDVRHPLEDVAHALDRGKAVVPQSVAAASSRSSSNAQRSAVRSPRAAGFTDLQEAPRADAARATEDDEPAADESGADVQTLGELLQQARESRGLSIEETSARTRISLKMLGHLENDRFGEFAADAYVKGFLRNYGAFLGLDVEMLVRRYETLAGHVTEAPPEVWEEIIEPRARPRRARPSRRTLTTVAIIVVVATLAWVFWSRGAAKLGLRPTPGLEQIENELRAVPDHAPRLEAGIESETPEPAPAAGAKPQAEPTRPAPQEGAQTPASTRNHPDPAARPASATTKKPAATTPAPRPEAPARADAAPTKPAERPAANTPPKPPPADPTPPRERFAPPPPEPGDPPR